MKLFKAALLLLAFDVILILAAPPLLHHALNSEQATARAAAKTEASLLRDITQLKDDAALADKLAKDLTEDEAHALLASPDRLALASLVEGQAEASDIDALLYTLGAETPAREDEAEGQEGLAHIALSLQGEAPDDRAAFAFVENIRARLPGRAHITTLTLTKKTGLSAANILLHAQIDALVNATTKETP